MRRLCRIGQIGAGLPPGEVRSRLLRGPEHQRVKRASGADKSNYG